MIEKMKTKNFINDEMNGVFDEIFEKIDQDGDGKIDYDEWVGAMSNKVELLNDENLKIAFDLIDKNGDGNIEVNELSECFM